MLKLNVIVLFICVQIFLAHCYTINRMQRNLWSDFDVEPTDEFLAKLLHTENLFRDDSSAVASSEQTDGHPRGIQKRGRQCLWKVCSWALDKRSTPSKLLY